MLRGMTKAIHIFRPGTHRPMKGDALTVSAADLAACAQAYDPLTAEAPIVVGHPQTDAPAYGWVRSLRFADGHLQADLDQVDPTFAELVNAGRYKHVSASFYLPDAPGNPKPGSLYLRHVGFLGAAAPAVKGLKAVSFSAADEGVVEFADWSGAMWSLGRVMRNLREWLIGSADQDTADRVLPDYYVRDIEDAARSAAEETAATPAPAFADLHNHEENPVTEQEAAQLRADNERLQAELRQAQERDAASKREARRAEVLSFVDGLATEGRSAVVRRKQAIVEFLLNLPADQTIEFADGTGTARVGADVLARELLAALPRDVPLGEAARAEGQQPGSVAFAAPHGYGVDAEAAELHAKALAYQKAHPDTAYLAAVAAVQGA